MEADHCSIYKETLPIRIAQNTDFSFGISSSLLRLSFTQTLTTFADDTMDGPGDTEGATILDDLCPHNSSTHETRQVSDRDGKEELHVRFKDTTVHQNVDSKPDAEEVSNGEELDSDDPKDVSIWRVVSLRQSYLAAMM